MQHPQPQLHQQPPHEQNMVLSQSPNHEDDIDDNASKLPVFSDSGSSMPNSNKSNYRAPQFVGWMDALRYTCWYHSTIMASPQQVIQTLYPYHVQDVPISTTASTSVSSTGTPSTRPRNDGNHDNRRHYVPWHNKSNSSESDPEQQQQQIASLVEILRQRLATIENSKPSIAVTVTPKKKEDTIGQNSSNVKSTPFSYRYTYSSIMSLVRKVVYSSNDDESTDYYCNDAAVMQSPSMYAPFGNRNDIDLDDYSSIVPKHVMTPTTIPTTTTTTLTTTTSNNNNDTPNGMDLMYISIDVMLDCIIYIQQQLQLRQRKFLLQNQNANTNRDDISLAATATTIIATIVSVHSIRKEWFASSSLVLPSDVSTAVTTDYSTTNGTTTDILNLETIRTHHNQMKNDTTGIAIAKFVAETISDQQFHWLLSVFCQPPPSSTATPVTHDTSTTNEIRNSNCDDSFSLLQRIDRDVYSGGSVYILQIPMTNDDGTDHPNRNEIRLTLYDLQQSMKTIQTNIDQWRNRIQDGAPMSTGGSTNNHRQQRLKYLQRKRLYEQHIDNAESTLLNLESIELSILHTIHVSRPTVSLLHQAKDVLQSLRRDVPAIEYDTMTKDHINLNNELELLSSSPTFDTQASAVLGSDDVDSGDDSTTHETVVTDDDIVELNARLQQLMSTDTDQSTDRCRKNDTTNKGTSQKVHALLC